MAMFDYEATDNYALLFSRQPIAGNDVARRITDRESGLIVCVCRGLFVRGGPAGGSPLNYRHVNGASLWIFRCVLCAPDATAEARIQAASPKTQDLHHLLLLSFFQKRRVEAQPLQTLFFNTYEKTGSAHLPSQSHRATKTSPRCLYNCTMAIGADAPTHPAHRQPQLVSGINGGNPPAALQERGERQEHETQLQDVDGNAAARRHTVCRRARSVQPDLSRNPDWRTARAASDRRSPAMPRSGK